MLVQAWIILEWIKKYHDVVRYSAHSIFSKPNEVRRRVETYKAGMPENAGEMV